MDQKTVIRTTKFILVELTKGYIKNILLNVAALGLLAVIGMVWMKIDEFRSSRKK